MPREHRRGPQRSSSSAVGEHRPAAPPGLPASPRNESNCAGATVPMPTLPAVVPVKAALWLLVNRYNESWTARGRRCRPPPGDGRCESGSGVVASPALRNGSGADVAKASTDRGDSPAGGVGDPSANNCGTERIKGAIDPRVGCDVLIQSAGTPQRNLRAGRKSRLRRTFQFGRSRRVSLSPRVRAPARGAQEDHGPRSRQRDAWEARPSQGIGYVG